MFDVLIIGCGVTGAAAAYALAKYDLKLGIIERFNDVACGATKANSAIMHAGYDPVPGKKEAALNRRGIKQAAKLCRSLDVEYRKIPSLVAAFNEKDMEQVRTLYERGIANGVRVSIIDGDEARKIEPSLSPDVIGALYTNESAIINPWEFALAMAEVAVVNGAVIMLENTVEKIVRNADYLTVVTDKGSYSARYVINAAGAHAPDICAMVGDDRLKALPRKGQYYVLDKEEGAKVGSVVFGCPDENGFKGILVAPTVHGNLLVGPTSDLTDSPEDLSTDPEVLSRVKAAGLKLVPGIDFRNVIRQYTGIRPTTNVRDFVIRINPCCDRMVDLASIASPGLSAATAIGEEAVKILKKNGLKLRENEFFKNSRPPVTRMKNLNRIRRRAVIKKDPAFGRIVCRCETVTEGEIIEAVHRPIPPRSIDAVKRRCGAGLGRCQGGFCSPRVHEILSRELGIPMENICLDKQGSFIITGQTKN
ncbi:MAG: NAD(P)/FAD-dependent oxidoreductase [Clostridia bacterium]|nr:NAD(P)/FAD-dependent oxidoreductase [Clostridia bacterium]